LFTGNPFVTAITVQPDNSILAGGFFTYNTTKAHLARILPNGNFDPGFSANPVNRVQAIGLEPDNQILVAGFSPANLIRLNQNGTQDGTFNAGAQPFVLTVAAQANSSILIGGTFFGVGNLSRPKLARITSSGSVDVKFDTGTGPSGGVPFINEYGELEHPTQVSKIVIESANSAIVAGNFSTLNGVSRPNVARIYLRNASLIDADNDGLPDWWEKQHGFDPLSGAGTNGGEGDFDGDGSTNRREYITGTNPRKASSFEPTVTIAPLAPGVRAIRFTTILDRTYRIQSTNDLQQPFVPVGPVIAGTGSEVTWVDDGTQTGGPLAARFYQLAVTLAVTE
jgi:hypothetical protein